MNTKVKKNKSKMGIMKIYATWYRDGVPKLKFQMMVMEGQFIYGQ